MAYRRAALVVQGRVTAVDALFGADITRVTVRVEGVWKGDANELLTFTTGTTCSYLVQPDERHLFFMGRSESGELTTGRCMGNSALNHRKQPDVLSWLQRRGAPGHVLAAALGR